MRRHIENHPTTCRADGEPIGHPSHNAELCYRFLHKCVLINTRHQERNKTRVLREPTSSCGGRIVAAEDLKGPSLTSACSSNSLVPCKVSQTVERVLESVLQNPLAVALVAAKRDLTLAHFCPHGFERSMSLLTRYHRGFPAAAQECYGRARVLPQRSCFACATRTGCKFQGDTPLAGNQKRSMPNVLS